jgi:hypothetical protein
MATEQTLDTVNNVNIKTVGEEPAWAAAQRQVGSAAHLDRMDRMSEVLFSDLLEHRKHINLLTTTYLGRVCDNASSIDPVEAISTAKAFKGESDSSITSLLAALAAGQISAKVANTTPPETGITQLFAQLNALTNQNSQNSGAIAAQNFGLLNAMNQTNQATNAAMAAIAQVLAKMAQTTPPNTSNGGGGSGGVI